MTRWSQLSTEPADGCTRQEDQQVPKPFLQRESFTCVSWAAICTFPGASFTLQPTECFWSYTVYNLHVHTWWPCVQETEKAKWIDHYKVEESQGRQITARERRTVWHEMGVWQGPDYIGPQRPWGWAWILFLDEMECRWVLSKWETWSNLLIRWFQMQCGKWMDGVRMKAGGMVISPG